MPAAPSGVVGLSEAQRTLGGTFSQEVSFARLVQRMGAVGKGGRGIVIATPKAGGPLHAFNVVNNGGRLLYLDASESTGRAVLGRFQSFRLLVTYRPRR